jgi:hypothetical protein
MASNDLVSSIYSALERGDLSWNHVVSHDPAGNAMECGYSALSMAGEKAGHQFPGVTNDSCPSELQYFELELVITSIWSSCSLSGIRDIPLHSDLSNR